MNPEIIAEWPETTLQEVMWEIADYHETGYLSEKITLKGRGE